MPAYVFAVRVETTNRASFDLDSLTFNGNSVAKDKLRTYDGDTGPIDVDSSIFQKTAALSPADVSILVVATAQGGNANIRLSARSEIVGRGWPDWVVIDTSDGADDDGSLTVQGTFDVKNCSIAEDDQ